MTARPTYAAVIATLILLLLIVGCSPNKPTPQETPYDNTHSVYKAQETDMKCESGIIGGMQGTGVFSPGTIEGLDVSYTASNAGVVDGVGRAYISSAVETDREGNLPTGVGAGPFDVLLHVGEKVDDPGIGSLTLLNVSSDGGPAIGSGPLVTLCFEPGSNFEVDPKWLPNQPGTTTPE